MSPRVGCMSSSCNWAAPAGFKGVDTDIYWPRIFRYGDVTLIYFNGIWPSKYGEIWPMSQGSQLAIDRCSSWLAHAGCESELQIPSQRSQGIPREFPRNSWYPLPEESVFVEVFLQCQLVETAWKVLLGSRLRSALCGRFVHERITSSRLLFKPSLAPTVVT
jgi:hypothetical protein